ncbi:MAG: orotate phosphoribosyltransferase [Actinomycetota bacterium]
MNPVEVMDVLERHGAVMSGHFRLASGRHSDVYVQKFRVLEHPRLAQRFGESIAQSFDRRFEVVACPAVGAIVLGFAVALAGDVRLVIAERAEGRLTLRRGFRLHPHEKVLVVEDVVTTGGSAAEVIDLARKAGAEPIGLGALIDRPDPARPPSLGVPLRALVTVDVSSWDPSECPLCEADQPIQEPGSHHLSA